MQNPEKYTLTRKDGKSINVIYYNNDDISAVEIFDIKRLNFEGLSVKDITKKDIHKTVLKAEDKIYLFNKRSKITAGLSKKHLNKIISTVFTKDTEGKFIYLKKEIISNIDKIFLKAIPILKHLELKKEILYNSQVIHRFALPLRIGNLLFFTMITVKERQDFQKHYEVEEFSIYDLFSQSIENQPEKSCTLNRLIQFVENNIYKTNKNI